MGQVYEAQDTLLSQRTVAIKVLAQNPDPANATRLREYFQEEAQVSAILGEHPRIIQVTDYGIHAEQPYLVMEYLGQPPRAQSLEQLLAHEQILSHKRVLCFAIQICEGLHYAHTFNRALGNRRINGVIHRDIKPSNIFVINQGFLGETIKILDFGIAKVISDASAGAGHTGSFVGTPRYASPEQLRGEPLTPSSDIYALGMLLYTMLTGKIPLKLKNNSFTSWYQAHNFQPPQPITDHLALPTELAPLVMACIAKEPSHRPPTMEALAHQLQAILQIEETVDISYPNTKQPIAQHNPTVPETPPVSQLTPLFLEQCSRQLAFHIGPLANLIIKETLEQYPVATSQEFVEALAAEIPDPKLAAAFKKKMA